MSAKRLKVEGMKGERAPRTRPRSLSSPMQQAFFAEEHDGGGGGGDARPPRSPPAAMMNLGTSPAASPGGGRGGSQTWHGGENLIRIESALGLHANFRHPNSLLSFDAFYALLGKVQLKASAGTTTTAAASAAAKTAAGEAATGAPHEGKGAALAGHRMPNGGDDLSNDERLLYHLLRVAVPVLYNVCQLTDAEAKQRRHDALLSSTSGGATGDHEAATKRASTPEPSTRKDDGCAPRRYYVERVGFRGNRIKELRRLVQECEPLTNGDDGILKAIRKHREATASTQRKPMKNTSITAGRPGPDEVVLTAGMTIDERVRAREEVRLKRNEQVARATADAAEAGETTMDRAWLVRVSDALWRHASDILARQNRALMSPQPKATKKVSFCTLTLRDAVSVLKRALSAPGANSRDGKTTANALVAAMLELTKLAPKWIQRTGTGDGSGKVLKDDTVWIYHSHYQEARALVGGKVPAPKPSPRPFATAKAGDSASKRSLDTPSILVPKGHVVTSDDNGATLNLPKKQRLERQTDDDPPPCRLRQEPPMASTNEMTPPPRSASKKPPLRINPHLILSDADYTGGEVIVPTFFDSPRGLKILFDNINAGNRI